VERIQRLYFSLAVACLVGLAILRIVGTIELSLLLDVELALERFV